MGEGLNASVAYTLVLTTSNGYMTRIYIGESVTANCELVRLLHTSDTPATAPILLSVHVVGSCEARRKHTGRELVNERQRLLLFGRHLV